MGQGWAGPGWLAGTGAERHAQRVASGSEGEGA